MKFKWMKNQTSLTIADSSVDSLQDLVFLPNLESLTLGEYGNNIPPITTMDGIENCTKLTSLTILYGPDKDYSAIALLPNLNRFERRYGNDYNNIITVLKSCENLETLTLRNLNITDMKEMKEFYALKYLDLSNNSITKIEGLENLSNLETLNLALNKITKIEGVENLTNLETLNLENNNIEDITPLSANAKLMTLNLKTNPQIDGNRSNYTGEKLEALNKIGEILDRGGTINLDVDKLGLFTNYKVLDLSSQGLTSLEPLEGLTELTYLNLNNNNLTLEDQQSRDILAAMESLGELNVSNNKISNLSCINELKNLTKLSASGNSNTFKLKDIENIISNLTILRISETTLNTINECNIEKVTKLYLNNSNITKLPDLSKFTKLVTLDIRGNPIKNFEEVEKIQSLSILFISSLNLHGRMIDFSQLTNLTNLDLSNNTLWSEDLENLKALKNNTNLTINLRNNSIIDATALLELNPNTKINLTGNINLSQESKDKLKARFGNNVTF